MSDQWTHRITRLEDGRYRVEDHNPKRAIHISGIKSTEREAIRWAIDGYTPDRDITIERPSTTTILIYVGARFSAAGY